MFQYKITFSVLVLLISLTTQAAVFNITPNVGYKNHTMKLTDVLGIDSDVKMSGAVYGLKLGIQTFAGVGFDLAGTYASGKAKSSSLGVETEDDYKHTTGALQLSVSANFFKIHLGYLLMNDFKINDTEFKGPGYQAGLALLLTSSISLGLQYEVHQFNKIKSANDSSFNDIKNTYSKSDSQITSVNLAVSF